VITILGVIDVRRGGDKIGAAKVIAHCSDLDGLSGDDLRSAAAGPLGLDESLDLPVRNRLGQSICSRLRAQRMIGN
jgi:hypothetical protein